MSYFSQFGGGTPAKITTYNSGSGTFTPISTNQSWARITLIGGGGGGAGLGYNNVNGEWTLSGGGGGGGGGSTLAWVKLNAANYAYAVGTGGAAGTNNFTNGTNGAGNGGNTTLGNFYAGGGRGGAVPFYSNYTGDYVYGTPGRGGSGTIPGGMAGGMATDALLNVNNYRYTYVANANNTFAVLGYTYSSFALPNSLNNVNQLWSSGGGSLYGYGGTGAGAGGMGAYAVNTKDNGDAGVAGLIYIEEFVQ